MIKRLILFLTCLFLTAGMALAQTRVGGVVVALPDNEPVVGASVKVVGTGTGTITDIDGKFSLSVPANAQLEISYIGMKTKILPAKANMRVEMENVDNTIDEVMVVAYGVSKKSSFTGSAQNVDNKKIELRPITSATKALEGNVSGLLMTSGTGQPGTGASIRVRGFGSINASNDPLYVLDGIPYDGSLNSINPSDIESITVLKDASAGALYGARGANGVVLITTKAGRGGKAQVTWRSTAGWASRSLKKYKTVSQEEYVQLQYENLRNNAYFNNGKTWAEAEEDGRNGLSGKLGGELYNPFKNYTWDKIIDPATGRVRPDAKAAWNENWLDAVVHEGAFRHEHQLSITGGDNKTQWLASLGYLNEEGMLVNTRFQRYSGRANINTAVTDWFSANLNLSLAHSKSDFSNYTGTANSNVWYSSQFINPLFPVYVKNADGTTKLDANGNPMPDYGESGRPGSLNDFSALGTILDDKSDRTRDIAGVRTGMVFGGDSERLGWFKGLKLALNFGLDYQSQYEMDYMNMFHGNQAAAGGLITKNNGRTQSYTFNQLLTYNRSFGEHHVDVLLGHEFYEYIYAYLKASKSNLVPGIYELRPGATMQAADSYKNVYRINSFLSRINYSFYDKYYFSASLRQDASSRFHRSSNKGTFWSLGGNWRVSNEAFMKDVKWVDNLNVKVSYGEQGNDNIGKLYAWQSLYSLNYKNADNVGGLISSLETKGVSWEKNGNLNAGLETSLFNGRVKLGFEYYYRKTSDMLLSYPMATSTGFDGYNANVGNVRNTGVEFSLSGTPIQTKDWRWELTWMGTTTNNKVLKLTKETPEIIEGVFSTKEGLPLNTFYMARAAGVDPLTGKQLYWAYKKDANGNMIEGSEYVTSKVAEATNSKYYLGSRIPDLYGSIGSSLTYKDFDLYVLTVYSIGGKVYDNLYASSMSPNYVNQTWHKNALRRWQKVGDKTDVPRALYGDASIVNDRFLLDASYFAIKNITLGYTLPASLIRKAGIVSARLFTSVDNLALFCHMDGLDPQYNFSGTNTYSYSPAKTWTVGFEVKF